MDLVVALGVLAGLCGGGLMYGDAVAAGDMAGPGDATQVCIVTDERLRESSGLALARRGRDAVWIHNDSGDSARLFLVGLDGNTRGVFRLKDVPRPVDWEDLCGFVVDGAPWLLVGDVGDNALNRHFVTPDAGPERACRLLLFPEPALRPGRHQERVRVNTRIQFEFEDGPHNCESVAVDTERKEILLVSKSKASPMTCGLYGMPLTLEPGTTRVKAKRIRDLDLPFATGMDVAPDNRRLAIISSRGAMIVDREANEGWGEAIQKEARFIALPKREGGETVCFGPSRDELYLNSEHAKQPLWRVTIPPGGGIEN